MIFLIRLYFVANNSLSLSLFLHSCVHLIPKNLNCVHCALSESTVNEENNRVCIVAVKNYGGLYRTNAHLKRD